MKSVERVSHALASTCVLLGLEVQVPTDRSTAQDGDLPLLDRGSHNGEMSCQRMRIKVARTRNMRL